MNVQSSEYQHHIVFDELGRYAEFYDVLAGCVSSFASYGTRALLNIDTYAYSSLKGSIESIALVLRSGRINDAYALLRKYHDSTTINIYADLYLSEHASIDNFVVAKIEDWLLGKEQLAEYRILSEYIRNSDRVSPITRALAVDDRYKRIRARCNGHMHYNFFQHVLLNDNMVRINQRGSWLNRFHSDLIDLFVRHCAYLFFINDHYMTASDYVDHLECGMQPPEDSQHWVAPFVQQMFHEVVAPRRPDVMAELRKHTSMQLE